ncbi:MAG: GNAT family N-acetyltransferase [Bacteroidota bacterium]
MYNIELVSTKEQIHQIAELSSINLRSVVDEHTKVDQGFLTWEYTTRLLEAMHDFAPSVIASYNNQVVGYALTATHAMSEVHKEMKVMLNNLSTLTYLGRPMNDYRFYMMGQICIAKEHRGKGLFEKLYQHHRTVYGNQFDFLLTEVSTSNHRSMRAHEKVGFKTIHTYHDHMDEWNVVVWDWK